MRIGNHAIFFGCSLLFFQQMMYVIYVKTYIVNTLVNHSFLRVEFKTPLWKFAAANSHQLYLVWPDLKCRCILLFMHRISKRVSVVFVSSLELPFRMSQTARRCFLPRRYLLFWLLLGIWKSVRREPFFNFDSVKCG